MVTDSLGVQPSIGIDVFALFRLLWRRKLLIAGVVAMCIVGTIVRLQLSVFQYSAELRVTPVQADSSSMMSNLSGLASLAGVSLPKNQTVSPFGLYVESLKGREIANRMSRDPEIMKVVFEDQWDSANRTWKQPAVSLNVTARRFVKGVLGLPVAVWGPPAGEDLYLFMLDSVEVTEDQKRNIVTMKFYHKNKQFAGRFLERLHQISDQALRERTLARASTYVTYLERRIALTTVGEHRVALADALGTQERLLMMASSNAPFAAEPFGSILLSAAPEKPRPAKMLIYGALLGIAFGILAALFAENRLIWIRKFRGDSDH